MRNKKGISLITLIITIVVLIILASISIFVGYEYNINKANFTKIYNEMKEVSSAIQERQVENRLDNTIYPLVGKKLTTADAIEINGVTYGEGYYLVTPEEMASSLGLSNVTREYIVNYSTGEVISKDVILLDNKPIYTLEELIKNQLDTELLAQTGEYDEEKGVNKPIVVNGMIPVKYSDIYNAWVVTSEDDDEWYDYSATANQWANVMLMDDIELEGMTNDAVRKSRKESLVGKKVTKEGSSFVWIPRYTYKEESSSVSVVYSKLTTDYTQDGYIKHPAFYFGEYTGAETDTTPNTGYKTGGKELTGIWISKYEAGYE